MRGNFGGRGWPGGRGGGSLEYTDDNIESCSSIFNNVVGKGKESTGVLLRPLKHFLRAKNWKNILMWTRF